MKCDRCGTETKEGLEAVIPGDEYEGFKAFLCKNCIRELEKADDELLKTAKKRIIANFARAQR